MRRSRSNRMARLVTALFVSGVVASVALRAPQMWEHIKQHFAEAPPPAVAPSAPPVEENAFDHASVWIRSCYERFVLRDPSVGVATLSLGVSALNEPRLHIMEPCIRGLVPPSSYELQLDVRL